MCGRRDRNCGGAGHRGERQSARLIDELDQSDRVSAIRRNAGLGSIAACGRERPLNAWATENRSARSLPSTQRHQEPDAPITHNAEMKPTKRLQSLIDEGLIDEVLRQLMSGKEADVYVVRCGNETRCAKVYKEADNAASGRPWITPRIAGSRTPARRGQWPSARGTGDSPLKRHGAARRSTRCTDWPRQECACLSRSITRWRPADGTGRR